MHNALGSLAKMMGENGKVMDPPWGKMDRSKWQSVAYLMQKALGSLSRMMGENVQELDLSWATMMVLNGQVVDLPCTLYLVV